MTTSTVNTNATNISNTPLRWTVQVEDDSHPYKHQISLYKLHTRRDNNDTNDRAVAFATAGDPNGTPTLFFYPAGGNRRMLLSLHDAAVSSKLKLISVNRPGTGGTDAVTPNSVKNCKNGGEAEAQVTTACEDCVRVLECLGIDSVGMLLFMCAGTPFALAFATQCGHLIRATNSMGRPPLLMGIGSWVLPADCSDTKAFYKFGAHYCPLWLSSSVAGGTMGSINRSMTSIPQSMLIKGFKKSLSDAELAQFDTKHASPEDFVSTMHWIKEEDGKLTSDLKVLLSSSRDIAIEYALVGQGREVMFLHGEDDTMVPIKGVEWLAKQIPSAVLRRLAGGTHEGSLFLLHSEIEEEMEKFGKHVCNFEPSGQ